MIWMAYGVRIIIRKGMDGLQDENHHTEGYRWLTGVKTLFGMIRTAYGGENHYTEWYGCAKLSTE